MSAPDLRDFDLIVVNSSAGKDSQTALRQVCLRAAQLGVLDRVVVQYNDLGKRVAWPSTREAGKHLVARYGKRPGCRKLARQQAAHYGVRFVVTRKDGGDLLDDIEARGKFPDAKRRWCTSGHKRGPGRRLLTQLVRELGLDRPARILHVFGFRAQESNNRAGKEPFAFDASASNATRRHVWNWYPIHGWTEVQVWADIRASGVAYHWAYDAGMSRLSCSFCVLGSKADLVTACRLRPNVARQYAKVEVKIGHSFQQNRSMGDLIEMAAA